jgi:hypothetical protein
LAVVRLKRASEMADLLRTYTIVVDGNDVGTIRRGKEVTFEVAPGQHRMWLRIDWCESNALEFLSDGTPLEFECGSNFRGWRAFLGVKHAVSSGPGYLWLRFKDARRE